MFRETDGQRGYSGFHHCVEQQSCLHLQQLSIYKSSSIVHTSYLCVSINWGMVLSSVNIFVNKDSISRKIHLLGVSRHKPAQTSCHLGRLHVTEAQRDMLRLSSCVYLRFCWEVFSPKLAIHKRNWTQAIISAALFNCPLHCSHIRGERFFYDTKKFQRQLSPIDLNVV